MARLLHEERYLDANFKPTPLTDRVCDGASFREFGSAVVHAVKTGG
jgi:hypothetical protein